MASDTTGWLRLSRSCNNACRFCCEAQALDGQDLSASDLVAELDGLVADGAERVIFSGGEPTLSPQLLTALEQADRRGLSSIMVSNGRALGSRQRLRMLSEAGLGELRLSLHGACADTHDDLVGAPGAFRQLLATLRALGSVRGMAVRVQSVLCAQNADELTQLPALLAEHGVRQWQLREPQSQGSAMQAELSVSKPRCLQLLGELAVACDAHGVRLQLHDFGRLRGLHPDGGGDLPAVLGNALLSLLRLGIHPPQLGGGLQLLDGSGRLRITAPADGTALRELGCELCFLGLPPVELPSCMGGKASQSSQISGPAPDAASAAACDSCTRASGCPRLPAPLARYADGLSALPRYQPRLPAPRVLIVAPPSSDPILCRSTLPALARDMSQLGARVQLLSPFTLKDDPDDSFCAPDPAERALAPGLSRIEAGSVSLAVVDAYETALEVMQRKLLTEDGRMLLTDLHMLSGVKTMLERFLPTGERASQGRWWPDDRLFVQSSFPGYAHLYRNYGVPFRQLSFEPYRLHGAHFPAGPDPLGCTHIFSGGNHLRDLQTLCAALAQLADDTLHPVEAFDEHSDALAAPHMNFRGFVPLTAFYESLRSSRFAVIPLHRKLDRAAGVTVMVMAMMAGRPVICSDVPAAHDHLRPGEDSLLVPAGDGAALAEQIRRLDSDESLLARMAEQARVSAERLSVHTWSRVLLGDAAQPDTQGTLEQLW